MIDYKTYEEQIQILSNRGLIINDENSAKDFLKANNYYNVVNAYKDIFIKKGVTPEKFISGATFDELIAIHSFDKQLRILLSNNLIIIERLLKSTIAYEFSKNHPNHDLDYLDINKFDTTILKAGKPESEDFTTAAAELIIKLNRELTDALIHNDEMICHYRAKYVRIPLWVFINKLSFGTVSKFFSLMQSKDKYDVSKSISSTTGKFVSPKEISGSMKILVLLRNKTAHDQKIYDFVSKPLTVSNNNEEIKKYGLTNVQSLFGAFACMSVFLTQKQYKTFCQEAKKLINELFLSIHSIPTQNVLSKMGIPKGFLK